MFEGWRDKLYTHQGTVMPQELKSKADAAESNHPQYCTQNVWYPRRI